MGMFYKRRDYTRIVNGRNPIVAHEFLGSSVEGKDVIILDDMISSGDSILDVATAAETAERPTGSSLQPPSDFSPTVWRSSTRPTRKGIIDAHPDHQPDLSDAGASGHGPTISTAI